MIESITVKFKNGKEVELALDSGNLTIDEPLRDLMDRSTWLRETKKFDLRLDAKISAELVRRLEQAGI